MAAAAVQPQPVLTIDPKHRLVEGVASDGTTIWVSSILDRQILACRAKCRTFATLPAGIHPFAIAWDSERKRLWVAADCPANVPSIKACDRGALVAYNVTGRLMTRIAPPSGNFHPGDVSASPAGVFVSDSHNGAVYRVAANAYSLTPVIPPGTGKSAQGSATDADGKILIVADYADGLTAIDLATGGRKLLRGQDGKSLGGIDGLARCGDTFFGIYNGATPGRLLRFKLSGEGVEYGDLIEGLTLPDPTMIALDGKRLLIVADSGWATLGKPDAARGAGTIVAVPLVEDCSVR